MNRIKRLTQYIYESHLRALLGYYAGYFIFCLLITLIASGGELSTNGAVVITIIVMGIVLISTFKTTFGFSQNNHLSRNYYSIGNCLSMLAISGTIALLEPLVLPNLYAIFDWNYEIGITSGNSVIRVIATIFFCSWMALSFFQFIALITYRMNKWVKIVFYASPFTVLPIVITAIYNFLTVGAQNNVIEILLKILSFIGECFGTFNNLVISCLVVTLILSFINYFILKILPLRLDRK